MKCLREDRLNERKAWENCGHLEEPPSVKKLLGI